MSAPRRLARAIREQDRRAVESSREMDYAAVTRVNPLTLTMTGVPGALSGREDLTLTAWVRSYDAQTGIEAGDTAVVKPMRDGTWLVTDILLSEGRPLFEGGVPDADATTKGKIQLAGDLAGTAAAPLIGALKVTDAKVAAANKDGAAGTASMRTLGTGATQATAGNDSRLSDARTPTAHTHAQADVVSLVSDLALKANLASPTFSGTPSLPIGAVGITQSPGNNTTRFATTEFVAAMAALKADLASPIFTGNPRAPTPATADNDTSIATTAYVKAQLPTYETALPGSPVDGQEIFYAAVPADGVIWHLRFRSAASGSFKWEFVGGSGMYHAVNTGQATAATHSTYQDLATVGPTLTVPLAGDYMIEFSCQGYCPGAGDFGRAAVKIGAAAALDADTVFQTQQALNNSITGGNRIRLPAVAVSTVLKIQYRSFSNAQSFYQERRMLIRPIRVG